ncbi:hypothetical protein GCM10011533_35680 [Streptosporangium jomthongense]|nr:hypothetical protein GCM10011533_35680 [Streptosporangium jomthongense]
MHLANVDYLGVKEFRSLLRDPIMLLIVYTAATAMPETLNKAPIAVVNEDRSPLSWRIVSALFHACQRTSSIRLRWTPAWMPGSTPLPWISRRNSSATC